MSCPSFHDALVDLAREVPLGPGTAAALDTHLAHCAACTARLARERRLAEALRELAGETRGAGASSAVERRLMEAFAARTGTVVPAQPAAGFLTGWRLAAAVLLPVLAGIAAVWLWSSRAEPPQPIVAAVPADTASILQGFQELPAAVGLPSIESGRIVRVELPVVSLAAYGVAMVPDPAKTQIEADLLIGQDGLPRAIRMVRTATEARSTP